MHRRGLGFRALGLGLGCRAWCLGFRAWGLGFYGGVGCMEPLGFRNILV